MKVGAVSKDELERFLSALSEVNRELYESIVKPKIPLELSLRELEREDLIKLTEKGILVNEEMMRSERKLRRWIERRESLMEKFDEVYKRLKG